MYWLAFDKVSAVGSAKCNIVHAGGVRDRVCGVLFCTALRDIATLDDAEGLGKGYNESKLPVLTEAGPRQANVYIAGKNSPLMKPYDWYKEFVVRGAEEYGLPDAHQGEDQGVIWLRI